MILSLADVIYVEGRLIRS